MSKKVSVIIPTYKRSDSLDRAIQSILNQSYKNIEIIIVDDNDELSEYRKINQEKMQKYKKYSHIIYLKHKKNQNGAAARNTGIRKATGEYIAFLDDDDYFLPTRIEKMVYMLENNYNYEFAYSSVVYTLNGKIKHIIQAKKSGNFKLDLLKQISFFGTGSNIFIKKSLIKKVGLFNENFIRHQDIEYLIRCFDYSNILAIDQILVVKCTDDKSNIPDFKKMLQVKQLFFETFKKEINLYPNYKNDIYFQNYYEMYNMYYKNKKAKIFLKQELSKYGHLTYKMKLKSFFKSKKIFRNIKSYLELLKKYKNYDKKVWQDIKKNKIIF